MALFKLFIVFETNTSNFEQIKQTSRKVRFYLSKERAIYIWKQNADEYYFIFSLLITARYKCIYKSIKKDISKIIRITNERFYASRCLLLGITANISW